MTIKPIRITKYRVDRWLNKTTNETLYGVSVKIANVAGWVRVACDSKAAIKDTLAEAEQYIADMKAERDSLGFKRAAA